MTGIDTHDMVLVHRAIRREIGLLPGLVRDASGSPQRADRLAAHATEMLDLLHNHHTGEDHLLWPVPRPRVRLDAALVDRMEAQHTQIAEDIARLQQDLADWKESADTATGARIAERFEAVSALLETHLTEEEDSMLPLVSQHVSQSEWDALGKHGFAAVPPRRRLAILAHILEDADPAERHHFLRQVPVPARLAYAVLGRRLHCRETTALRHPNGTPFPYSARP